MELHATKTLQTPSTRCWLQKYSHTLFSAAGVSAGLPLTVTTDRQTDDNPKMPFEWILCTSQAGNERLDSYKML